MARRKPPKTKEITLKELLYKIRKTYDDAIDTLRKEQEQKLREAKQPAKQAQDAKQPAKE